jgi:hypothetical protein
MLEQLVGSILDESRWLTASMTLALAATAAFAVRRRRTGAAAPRRLVLAAMTLFFGLTVGTMAFGHLLAVSVKLAMGTLGGSIPALYAIGAALATPSLLLVRHARRLPDADEQRRTTTMALNAWLSLTLLALGPQNLPLAAPGLLNIGYVLHSRPVLGWALAALAVLVNLGLLAGSLVFLASGQTFEQFRGIE